MKILALDLGKFNTMCCFFDTKTRKHRVPDNAPPNATTSPPSSRKHKIDLVVMEACGPSGWINDLAVSLGLKTLVCSTNEDAWKWSNVKRKTDKDDALKLARMAAMNELKAGPHALGRTPRVPLAGQVSQDARPVESTK